MSDDASENSTSVIVRLALSNLELPKPPRTLASLSLVGAGLDSQGVSELLAGLRGARHLSLAFLDLSGNPLGLAGAHTLADALTAPSPPTSTSSTTSNFSVQILWARGCGIGTAGARQLALALVSNRSENGEAETKLSAVASSDASVVEAQALPLLPSAEGGLVSVDRGFKRLRLGRYEADLSLTCAQIVNLSDLETPLGQYGRYEHEASEVSNDNDQDEGWLDVVVVATLLGVNDALTVLDLSGCALCGVNAHGQGKRSSRAIVQFARALMTKGASKKSSLRDLRLARNMLDGAAAAALAPGLHDCTALQKLDLSRNLLNGAALRALAGALPLSTQALALGGNDFGPPGAAVVATLLGARFCLDPSFPLPLPTTLKEEAAAAAAAAAHPGKIEATASMAGRLVAAAAKAHSHAARQEEEGTWLLGSFAVNLRSGIGLGLSNTLRVTRVDNAGPAYVSGVRVGARVVSLGGNLVSALPDFVAGLQTLRKEGAQTSLVEYLQPPIVIDDKLSSAGGGEYSSSSRSLSSNEGGLGNFSSPGSIGWNGSTLNEMLPSTLEESALPPPLLPPPPNEEFDAKVSNFGVTATTVGQDTTEVRTNALFATDSTTTWMPGKFDFNINEGAGLGLNAALRVTRVNEGSAASLAGVGIGAKLTALGGVKVTTLNEFIEVLNSLQPSAKEDKHNDGSEMCTVDFEWPIKNLDAPSATSSSATTAEAVAVGETLAPITSLATLGSSGGLAVTSDSIIEPGVMAASNQKVKPTMKESSQPRAQALRLLPKLQSLDLNRTGLGVEGAWLLAAGLRAGGARRLASLDVSRNSIGSLGKAALGVAMVRCITPHDLPPVFQDVMGQDLGENLGNVRGRTRRWPDLQNLVCDEWATGRYIREANELDSNGLAPLPGSGAVMVELCSTDHEGLRDGIEDEGGSEKGDEIIVQTNESDLVAVNHGDESNLVNDNEETMKATAAEVTAVEQSEEDNGGYQSVSSALSKGGLVLDLTDRGLNSSDLLLLSGALMRHRGVRLLLLADNPLIGASADSAHAGPVAAAVGVCNFGGWGIHASLAPDGFSGPPLSFNAPSLPPLTPPATSTSSEAVTKKSGAVQNSVTSSKGSQEKIGVTSSNNDSDNDEALHNVNNNSSNSSSSGGDVLSLSSTGAAAAKALSGDGLSTLLAVLSRSNSTLEALSLRQVSLSGAQATACLSCLRLKPGLRLDLMGCLGASVSGRLRASVERNLSRAQNLETEVVPLTVVKLHMLGASGVGKTTLRRCLDRTRLQRIFGGASADTSSPPPSLPHVLNAPRSDSTSRVAHGNEKRDAGGLSSSLKISRQNSRGEGGFPASSATATPAADPDADANSIGGAAYAGMFGGRGEGGRRTLGCCVETLGLPIMQPPPLFSVWDWGGDATSEAALHGLHLLGGSPNALVAVVVRLTDPPALQRFHLKRWLRLAQASMPALASSTSDHNSGSGVGLGFVLIGTGGDQVGKLGPDMLARLWASATSELSREQRQAAAALLPSNDANTSSSSSGDGSSSSALETGTNERREIVRAEGAAVVVVRETPAKVPKLKKHEVLVLVTCPDACTGNDSLEIVVESVVYRITVPALVEPGQPFYVRVPKQPTWWTSKASQQNTSDQLQPSSSSSPSPSAPVPVLHPPQLSTLVFDESNPAEVREANSSVPDSTPADGAALAPPVGLAPSAPSDYSNGVTSSSISISSSSTGSTSSSISESVSSSSSRSYRRSSGVTAEWSLPRIVGFYAVDGRSIDAKLNALRQWLAEQHVRVLRDCFATTPVGLSLRLHQVLGECLEEWRKRGACALRFHEFVHLCREECCPNASDSSLVTACRMLHHGGHVIFIEHDGLVPLDATTFIEARKQVTRSNSNDAQKEQPQQQPMLWSAQEDTTSDGLTSPSPSPLGWVVLSPGWLTSQLIGRLVALGENFDAIRAHDNDSEDDSLGEGEVDDDGSDADEDSTAKNKRYSGEKGHQLRGTHSSTGIAKDFSRSRLEERPARHILTKDLMKRALRPLITARTIDIAHLDAGSGIDTATVGSAPVSVAATEQSEAALFPRSFGDIEDLMTDLGLAYSDCLPKVTSSDSSSGGSSSREPQSVLVVPSLLAPNDSSEPPLSSSSDDISLDSGKKTKQQRVMRLPVRAPLLFPGLFPRLCVRLAVLLGPPISLSPWSASFCIDRDNRPESSGVTVALETYRGGVGGPNPGVWVGAFVVRLFNSITQAISSTMGAADASGALSKGAENDVNTGRSLRIDKTLQQQQRATTLKAVVLAKAAIDSACYDCPALKLGEWTGELREASSKEGGDIEDFNDENGTHDDEVVRESIISETSTSTLDRNLTAHAPPNKQRAADECSSSAEVVQGRVKILNGDDSNCTYHRPGLKAQLTVKRTPYEVVVHSLDDLELGALAPDKTSPACAVVTNVNSPRIVTNHFSDASGKLLERGILGLAVMGFSSKPWDPRAHRDVSQHGRYRRKNKQVNAASSSSSAAEAVSDESVGMPLEVAMAKLAKGPFPLFVALAPLKEKPVLRTLNIYQTLVVTNRAVVPAPTTSSSSSSGQSFELSAGELLSNSSYFFDDSLHPNPLNSGIGSDEGSSGMNDDFEEQSVLWALSTVAMPSSLPPLGRDMFIDTTNIMPCGWVHLSQRQAYDIVRHETIREASSHLNKTTANRHHNHNYSSGSIEPANTSKMSSVLFYVHGFSTTTYFVAVNSAVYARSLLGPNACLLIAVSWPSAPKTASTSSSFGGLGSLFGSGSMLSLFISKGLDQPYAMAFNQMQASVNAFMGTMVNLRRLLDEAASSISSLHGGDSTGVSGGSSAASSSFSVQMHWKVHSMGSHLMLGLVERAHWAKEPLSKLFAKVILDAPDVPTWEFRERVSRLAVAGVHVLHLFNPFDQAVDVSRQRREVTDLQCPGGAPMLAHQNVTSVDCRRALSSSSMQHDYGRKDGFCLMEQRDFLAGCPPGERQLVPVLPSQQVPGHWILRTGR